MLLAGLQKAAGLEKRMGKACRGEAVTVASGTMRMDKTEIYKGFEIRVFEREQGRWRAEIRKADGSPIKILVWGQRTPHVDYYDC